MKGFSLKRAMIGAACLGVVLSAGNAMALTVAQTTNGTALATALGGTGLTIDSVSIATGAASQFGTYAGFTSPPVTIGDGVVLSSGQVVQTTAAYHNPGSSPSTNTGQPGTAEFNAYGPGHITNFGSSYDVAALKVNFTLSSASQVGFNFVFGSVEYPVFTNSFTDAFMVFLDGTGTSNQIVFDSNNNAVQVGTSFANLLTTADTNTSLSNPHGLLKLQTFTEVLDAGSHFLIFEVGDVNDHVLDSAVFINNLHAGQGDTGTGSTVPEPSTFLLLGVGLGGLALWRRRK